MKQNSNDLKNSLVDIGTAINRLASFEFIFEHMTDEEIAQIAIMLSRKSGRSNLWASSVLMSLFSDRDIAKKVVDIIEVKNETKLAR